MILIRGAGQDSKKERQRVLAIISWRLYNESWTRLLLHQYVVQKTISLKAKKYRNFFRVLFYDDALFQLTLAPRIPPRKERIKTLMFDS